MTDKGEIHKVPIVKDYSGICLLYEKFYNSLIDHKNYSHSNKDGTCTFCQTVVNPPELITHIHRQHQALTGLSRSLIPNFKVISQDYSGEALKEMIKMNGMITSEAVAYDRFVVCHDNAHRCYQWVAYCVTKHLCDLGKGQKYPAAKYQYCDIVKGDQVNSFTLNAIDVEHGHGTSARLHAGDPQSFEQCCRMPNISAQRRGFNSGLMVSSENHERKLAEFNESVIVLTGPCYETEGDQGWEDAGCGYYHRIPKAFFKFYVIKNSDSEDEHQAFILPNKKDTNSLFFYTSTLQDIRDACPELLLLPSLHNLNYSWGHPQPLKKDTEDVETKMRFCRICKIMIKLKDYENHQREHKNANTCFYERCFETFETKEQLKAHIETHKKLTCDWIEDGVVCGYTCVLSKQLSVHKETHLERRIYLCIAKDCKKTYRCEATLRWHINKEHSLIKLYYCPVHECEKGFSARQDLKKHLLLQHAIRREFFCPFPQCIAINKRFPMRDGLRTHMRREHGMTKAEKIDDAIKDQSNDKPVDKVLRDNGIEPGDLNYLSGQIKARKTAEFQQLN